LADLAPIAPQRSQGLVDVLDRILDKGLVIAGDIKVNLANVELLTVQVRLLVCSIDKAEQIGLNWWKYDPALSGTADQVRLVAENQELRDRVQALEERLNRVMSGQEPRPTT
jgi:Gas vesicle protein